MIILYPLVHRLRKEYNHLFFFGSETRQLMTVEFTHGLSTQNHDAKTQRQTMNSLLRGRPVFIDFSTLMRGVLRQE